MFKRLRERIAEEATRLPGGQHAFGNNSPRPVDSQGKSSEHEDLITLSDSPAVIDPHPSSQQFSIAGEEDGSFSDQNSPQRKMANSSVSSELFSASNSKHGMEANNVVSPGASHSYIPQTDIESEMEEPPTLNLDGISKEQLLSSIDYLKAKLCKYRNKYSEAVKAFKSVIEEKKKLEHTLTENQDKSLRRIAELREQCQLEQKAKAHLEENLRLILEEKDSRISVLETQINLLKEAHAESSLKSSEHGECQTSSTENAVKTDTSEMVEKLQQLLKECKATILAKSNQINEFTREKEVLCQKIVTQSKASEEFEEKEELIRLEYEESLKKLRQQLTELEQQHEESVMSMAETKRNMHEELELKERQLVKTKDEVRHLQIAVDHEKAVMTELRKQHENEIEELQRRLENTEKVMEEGKQSLISELSRGKAEAIALIQQESVKKLAKLEEEWTEKLQNAEMRSGKSLQEREYEIQERIQLQEKEILIVKGQLENKVSQIESLEKEKESLFSKVAALESKVKLRNENSKLNSQLDESLLVAAANQAEAAEELSSAKYQFKELQDQLSEKDMVHSERLAQLEQTICDLQAENSVLEVLKHEKERLSERVNCLETEMRKFGELKSDLSSLQVENETLKTELDSVASLKQEKDELNSNIRSLEHARKDLSETVQLLTAENNGLRTRETCLNEKVLVLESESDSLASKLKELENSEFKCPNCSVKDGSGGIHRECEEKLRAKDEEMESKLKLVNKEFCTQMNLKDIDCDQTVSELIEKSQSVEEKLQREHRLEIAVLQKDILEKDFALEEMHEHYEDLIKEKDAVIKEYGKNLKPVQASAKHNSELQSTEPSDWDDTWVVPEESSENISPAHPGKVECEKHKQEIETLQDELEKSNSEIKDLRILLRLTPPQSLHSNSNCSPLIPISEPTEFEYLKNILFEYMMGKETVTLVKVIAAVLRFSDEQTQMIVEKEKLKHQAQK